VLDAFRYTHNLSKSKHEATKEKKPHTIDRNPYIIFAQKHRNRKLGVMVEPKKINQGIECIKKLVFDHSRYIHSPSKNKHESAIAKSLLNR
jgi:hypothetical protein